jgi:hypothetical protein
MLTSEQLDMIQGLGALVFLVSLGAGALYLLLGLVQPAWVRRSKRRWVVATTFAVWFLGIAAYVGAVAFTHSHPNGPHAFKGYFERYLAEQCAQGQDLPACRKPDTGAGEGAGAAPAGAPAP